MLALLLRIVGNLGTVATAGGVLTSGATLSTLVESSLWGLIILAVVVGIVDVGMYYKTLPKRYPPQSEKIHKYMCEWLSQGGHAAVFSRDLSWVTPSSEAARILTDKAKRGELILFVAKETDLTRDLLAAGAQIYLHAKTFTPQSRFTIIDYNKAGARVAIGQVENGRHTIREYHGDAANVLALANDLVRLGAVGGRLLK